MLGYGATIHECEPVLAAREETCKKVLPHDPLLIGGDSPFEHNPGPDLKHCQLLCTAEPNPPPPAPPILACSLFCVVGCGVRDW